MGLRGMRRYYHSTRPGDLCRPDVCSSAPLVARGRPRAAWRHAGREDQSSRSASDTQSRLPTAQVILAATTTGQAATIGANRSFIWSGGCARCALDTTSCNQCHSGSELRLRVGNDLLVYHPLCFAQRRCATTAQQDHPQCDHPLRLRPQAGGSEPCSPGISQADRLRLIKTSRHAT
jgi:hypothetical protein